jgi:photosystem II stability/assembly factor-like uncharacterized protein
VPALAIDPAPPHALFAGTEGGVWVCADGGATWVERVVDQPFDIVSAIAPGQSGEVGMLIGTKGAGIYQSADGGAHWTASNAGLVASQILSLAVPKTHPATVYAGLLGAGIYRSDNRGLSWTRASSGLTDLRIWEIVLSSSDPTRAYAGTNDGGVFRSDDGGLSWSPASSGLGFGRIWSLAVDPLNPDTAFAGMSGNVFKTTDGGQGWAEADSGLPSRAFFSLVFDPANPAVLYAGGDGVFRTDDGGAAWSAVGIWGTSIQVEALALDPIDGRTVYAGSYGAGVRMLTLPGRPLWIPVVTHAPGLNSSTWRSDVWVLNPGDDDTTVTLRFYGTTGPIEGAYPLAANSQAAFADVVGLLGGAGGKVAGYSIVLAAGEWRLEVRPFAAAAGLTNLHQAFARVTLESGKAIVALASVVDNRTNDPTTVALVR